MRIVKLGYIELGTKNIDAMTKYYEEIIGLTVVKKANNGSVYLSAAVDHHNIVLTPSDTKGSLSLGYQISRKTSLEDAAATLKEHKVESEFAYEVHPGIQKSLAFTDAAGNLVHLYKEMEFSGVGFKETGIAPFNLNHVSYSMPPEEQPNAVGFYRDVLGFHVTDWVEGVITFMTCNHYYHVVNFLLGEKTKLHHLAFELRNWDHMAKGHDLLAKNNIPVLWGPTRHGAGHPISSYHQDPDGNLVELTFDLDIYNYELRYQEPRPWHEDFPQKPKAWNPDEMLSKWATQFGTDITKL